MDISWAWKPINSTPTRYKKMNAHCWCQITHVASQKQHNQIWLDFLFHLLPMWAKPLVIMERCHVEICSLAFLSGEFSELVLVSCCCIYSWNNSNTQWYQSQKERFQLPRLEMKITQALVTTLITLWFLN